MTKDFFDIIYSNRLKYKILFFGIFLLVLLLFPTPLRAASVDSSIVQKNHNSTIYIVGDAFIYNAENITKPKIIHIKEKFGSKSDKKERRKLSNLGSNNKTKIFVSKKVAYQQLKSKKKIYDPASTSSIGSIAHQKFYSGVSNTNFQNFSKFQNTSIYQLLLRKKFTVDLPNFFYTQGSSLSYFSQNFTVRPPPFS